MNYSMRGGARFGNFNVSYPFATLSVGSDSIIIEGLGKRACIPKSKIRALSRHRGMFSVGLRIAHECPTIPSRLIFWASLVPFNSAFEKLKAQLVRLGYAVSD